MRIEASSYNQGPELNGRIDVSHWAFGDRSRTLLQRQIGKRQARSRFIASPQAFELSSVTLFLPGTVVQAESTFGKQIPVVEENSGVVLVDYSDVDFHLPLFRAQIMDFLDSPMVLGKRVSMVGMSLGAANIIDLLFSEKKAQDRIERVVLLGTVYSSHDLNPKRVIQRARAMHSITPEIARAKLTPVAVRTATFIRKRVKIDPDPMIGDKSEEIDKVTNKSLLERLASILRRERIEQTVARLGRLPTPATFIRWEIDESDPQRHEIITQAFQRVTVAHIPGSHGWTHTSAEYINPLLSSTSS